MSSLEGVHVLAFAITYSLLTDKLKSEDPDLYNILLLCAESDKLSKGFKVKRINKANKKGTMIHFQSVGDMDYLMKRNTAVKKRCFELMDDYVKRGD